MTGIIFGIICKQSHKLNYFLFYLGKIKTTNVIQATFQILELKKTWTDVTLRNQ